MGDEMTPTNKLRFVDRDYWVKNGESSSMTFKERVLQQWWEDNSHDIHWTNGAPGEWRDVPLEEEK